jgi:hypothetical protein
MKRHSVLGMTLLTLVAPACSDGEDVPWLPGAGASGMGTAGAASGGVGGGASGSAGAGAVSGAGTGGVSGSAGTGAEGGAAGSECVVPALMLFPRSDTNQAWDDNDFSDVVLEGTCPVMVNVTWPHEVGWANADPADADHESAHFTVDSYSSADLAGKQLNLSIELAGDERGPAATAGAYVVSLVSVSQFERVIEQGGAGTAGSGGASGNGGTSGNAGSAGMDGGAAGASAGAAGANAGAAGASAGAAGASAGAAGAGGVDAAAGAAGMAGAGGASGDSSAGAGGMAPVTEIGYAEAESPVAERVTLRFVGDRATARFALPAKTTAIGSFDPSRAIKINFRIYSVFSDGGQTMGMGGMAGMAGMAGTSGAGSMNGGASGASGTDASGASGGGGMTGAAGAGAGGLGGGAGEMNAGASGASAGTAGAAMGSGGAGPAPVYAYLTSRFAITSFTITDAGSQ